MHAKAALGNPAEAVINLLGGNSVVAEICKVNPTQVWRWKKDRDAGGLGRRIPRRHWKAIRRYASENNIKLPIELLVPELAE